jgi:tetratricopeptide (TPR) repeat protein
MRLLLNLPPIIAIALYLHVSHGIDLIRTSRRVQRDDWLGALASADRLLRRRSNLVSRGNDAQAHYVAGVAELVVGSVPAARQHFEHLLDDANSGGLRAAGSRQLVSVDRLEGDLVRARERLGRLDAPSPVVARFNAVQLGLVELDDDRPAAAVAAFEAAPPAPDAPAFLPGRRRAHAADEAQRLTLLARARQRAGDLTGAATALDQADRLVDDRPYVRGGIEHGRGDLAAAGGDPTAAAAHLSTALAAFEGIGAAIDGAQVRVSLGRLRRDPAELDQADATFVERGAPVHRREVAAARRDLGFT